MTNYKKALNLPGLLFIAGVGDPTDPRYRMSPDPSTGGEVPLPEFDEDGNYFPPTNVPMNPTPLPMPGSQPPRNKLAPRGKMDPKELQELLKRARQSGVPKKISF